jgi:hypothetical protein
MAWTDITNTFIAVGKAVRARDIRALRDNFAAMAAGEAGAPRIQRAAIAPEAVGVTELATSVRPSATLTGQLYSGVFDAIGEVALLVRQGAGSEFVGRGDTLSGEEWGFLYFNGDSPGLEWAQAGSIPVGSQWRATTASGALPSSSGSQVVMAVRVA